MKDRYVRGLTDYRYRWRMLKNYEKICRVVFGKKNRYSYAGLYVCRDPKLPDECVLYVDTRLMEGDRRQREQELGRIIGKEGSRLNLQLVIDRGRRRKIRTTSFQEGLKETEAKF